jgi:phosphatidylethanolamine/phosphatidyl-N-methylethanolamine N-methyltransferase
MPARMQEEKTSAMYDVWSKFYDYSFGACVRRRQWKAVQTLDAKAGDKVLDLGVGTGMTLAHYPKDVEVVGLDLSPGMLAKAKKKVAALELENVRLVLGDAMHPPFEEGSFDHVLVTHVISVVSDPVRLLANAKRMAKPGGRVVILNHFQSPTGFVRFFERVLNPMFVKIGWRSDLELAELLKQCPMGVAYQFKLGVMDLWQIVVLTDDPRLPRVSVELSTDGGVKRLRSAVSTG